MKKVFQVLAALVCLGCMAAAQGLPPNFRVLRPYGQQSQAPPSNLTITYNGGPVMGTGATVYVIYYGSWSTKAKNIINRFIQSLNGSPQFNVNTTYFDKNGAVVQNVVLYDPAVDS